MSLYLLQGAVEEGLIYALVALGLFVSYKILKIADMTTDGSFVLGAALSSVVVISGHPILGLLIAVIGGAVTGVVTAFMQTKLGIPSILAGIISMTGLYTINLLVQGGTPNLFYSKQATIFTMAQGVLGKKLGTLILLSAIVLAVCVFLILFFTTQLGLSIRATGDNINMVQASSINPTFTITVGLALSNALVALAGGLIAQKNTQGDINVGVGIVVIGLASLVLGNVILRSEKISVGIFATVIGAVVYRIIFTIALKYTPDPGYLKIVSALIVAVLISYPTVKQTLSSRVSRARGGKNVRDK